MCIQMIGIDHTQASIDVRSVFSFTKANISKAMETWRETPGLLGCVMIATCNRMELWASLQEDAQIDLFELVCSEKNAEPQKYRQYVVQRSGREAVRHLFELSCGLKSKILGEDQIITQVKDALAFAREQYATDNVLEVLFRMAVTAGKKVKTEVVLSGKNSSAIHRAVEVLKQEGCTFRGKKCMVIGNGEMGKLSASLLEEEGADVTVTVRQYRSGVVDIPRGCSRIDYGERLKLLPQCDYVVSATASPNYTLKEEQVKEAFGGKEMIMVDLAVPRDIEVSVGNLPGVTLYDIDHFDAGKQSDRMKENIVKAHGILEEQMEEFIDWYEGRDIIETAQKVKAAAVGDFHLRIQRQMHRLEQMNAASGKEQEEQLQKFGEYIEAAAGKVVNKMLFGLRAKVGDKTFRECVEALKEIYEE